MHTQTDLVLSRHLRPGLCPACSLTVYELTCDQCGAEGCGCSVCRVTMDLLSKPGATVLQASGLARFGCVGDEETVQESLEPYVPDSVAPAPAPVVADPRPWYASPDDDELEKEIAMPTAFRSLLRLCGLSGAEAEAVLGQKEGTIRKKSAGLIPYTPADLDRLRALWSRIEANDVTLNGGAREAALALETLRETTAL